MQGGESAHRVRHRSPASSVSSHMAQALALEAALPQSLWALAVPEGSATKKRRQTWKSGQVLRARNTTVRDTLLWPHPFRGRRGGSDGRAPVTYHLWDEEEVDYLAKEYALPSDTGAPNAVAEAVDPGMVDGSTGAPEGLGHRKK